MSWAWPWRSKLTVGVSSRSSQMELSWLIDLLKSRDFQDHVSDVKYLQITNSNSIEWRKVVEKCSAGILYHSRHHGGTNITDIPGALYDNELLHMYKTLGQQKVIVVLDDLEQTGEDEKQRILETQPSIRRLSRELFLVPKNQKEKAIQETCDYVLATLKGAKMKQSATTLSKEYSTPSRFEHSNHPESSETSYNNFFSQDNFPTGQQIKTSFNSQWSKIVSSGKSFGKEIKTLITQKIPRNLPCLEVGLPKLPSVSQKHTISVFSRSARSNYLWLMSQLQSPSYGDLVQEVRDVYISNDYSQFTSHLSECSFAILYHTRKHGRLNITDVKDSLYDKELEDLYLKLGREKVMVVIDDLEVSSEEEKIRILQYQPSIGTRSGEMFIFSEEEKKQRNTSSSSGDLVEERKCTWKLQRMKEFIRMSLQHPPWPPEESSKDQQLQRDASTLGVDGCHGRKRGLQNDAHHYGEPETKKRPQIINPLRAIKKEKRELIGKFIATQRDDILESFETRFKTQGELERAWEEYQNIEVEEESQVVEGEGHVQERESHVQERESHIQERESHVQERESHVQERESHVKERESHVQERESHIQELERTIQERETLIQELQQIIDNQQDKILEQEHTIAELTRHL